MWLSSKDPQDADCSDQPSQAKCATSQIGSDDGARLALVLSIEACFTDDGVGAKKGDPAEVRGAEGQYAVLRARKEQPQKRGLVGNSDAATQIPIDPANDSMRQVLERRVD